MQRRAIRFLLGWWLCWALISPVQANPILVGTRPHRLASETVQITVGERSSEIVGEYLFIPRGPKPKTYQIANLEFPIIVPDPITPEIESEFLTKIHVKCSQGRGAIRPMRAMDDDYYAPPGLPKLPAGWRYAFVAYWLDFMEDGPLHVRIAYRQPHLPGGVAPYLPILPKPHPAGRYVIRFQPAPGWRLEPVGKWPGTSETVGGRHVFSARPRHRQLLQVRVAAVP